MTCRRGKCHPKAWEPGRSLVCATWFCLVVLGWDGGAIEGGDDVEVWQKTRLSLFFNIGEGSAKLISKPCRPLFLEPSLLLT